MEQEGKRMREFRWNFWRRAWRLHICPGFLYNNLLL